MQCPDCAILIHEPNCCDVVKRFGNKYVIGEVWVCRRCGCVFTYTLSARADVKTRMVYENVTINQRGKRGG